MAVALASHITEMVGWADAILNQDELNFDPATYKPRLATTGGSVTTNIRNFKRGKQNAKNKSVLVVRRQS